MSFFLLPTHVKVDVVVSLDPDLLALIKQILDTQNSDAADAAALSLQARATTEALSNAIPSPT